VRLSRAPFRLRRREVFRFSAKEITESGESFEDFVGAEEVRSGEGQHEGADQSGAAVDAGDTADYDLLEWVPQRFGVAGVVLLIKPRVESGANAFEELTDFLIGIQATHTREAKFVHAAANRIEVDFCG